MKLQPSIEHSRVSARQMDVLSARNSGPVFVMDSAEIKDVDATMRYMRSIGVNLGSVGQIRASFDYLSAVMDSADLAPLNTLTTQSISTPIQFLQNWLPGFVRVISAARKIDEILGISTTGSWDDEEVVQGVLEPTGLAQPYSDSGNVPLSSYNNNYERRTVVRFEKGFTIGRLEEARTARARIASAAEKRTSSSLSLEISRNRVGFYGYNNGNNRTYGFLNDPSLIAAISAPNGASGFANWGRKTFLEITADIRFMVATLRTQAQDTISPEKVQTTLVLPTDVIDYLSTTAVYGSQSVMGWIKETYPQMRIVSAPELMLAVGGVNVAYLFAESVDDGASDDSRTWVQVVPAKFQTLGVEQRAKGYLEDFVNATAGVMLKRPYAVVRMVGV